ncbi:hypothetical protein PIB30_117172 [Stylosanthes scabra]|uniref:Endonuclease/exonuclease/phosphatase domain-containing protein n=1 Tax=Stylosanthes scabra TaxID=79078 RepID=A0ABU6UBV3_9FABA|nr:hypothetical protein [Stylosanthes scabra]
MSLNHIDMEVNLKDSNIKWRATGFYGYPESYNKHESWNLLKILGTTFDLPWLVFGDFNQVINQSEKQGDNPIQFSQVEGFLEARQINELADLGFKGHPFTWSNGQSGTNNIQERLDRALARSEWKQLFPKTSIQHLSRYKSDHSPLLLNLAGEGNRRRRRIGHTFKFEEFWLSNSECSRILENTSKDQEGDIVEKIKRSGGNLDEWGKTTFGDIQKRIKEAQESIATLNNSPQSAETIRRTREEEADLDELLKLEEIKWSQRSRASRLKHGDRNTAFFHQKASQRKKRNWVESIYDDMGIKYMEEEQIEDVMRGFYEKLFTSEETRGVSNVTEAVKNRLSPNQFAILDEDFSKEEVHHALFQMHPTKAPDPDGLPALFSKRCGE